MWQYLIVFLFSLAIGSTLLVKYLRKYNHFLIYKGDFPYLLLKAAGLQKFGKYLNISRQIIGEISLSDQDGILRFGYIVPDHLCHNHPTKETYLDLGAILALTDEITTVVLMCGDKDYRPGVSVSLSGELYCHEIRPGQNILIEAYPIKIGSTLAFTEIYFVSLKDKSTLARGSHIKFMKMGFLWDFLSPWVPMLLQIFLKNYRTFFPSAAMPPFSPPRNSTSKPLLDSLFSLQSTRSSHSLRREYSLASHETLLNLSENMHGGAIALAFQDAVWRYCRENDLPIRRIRCMEISYLAPCKGSLRITVTPFNHLQPGHPSLSPSSSRHRSLRRSSSEDENQSPRDRERDETLTYRPTSDPVDTFRVLIRRTSGHIEEGSEKNKSKNRKSNQIYAQGMIILY